MQYWYVIGTCRRSRRYRTDELVGGPEQANDSALEAQAEPTKAHHPLDQRIDQTALQLGAHLHGQVVLPGRRPADAERPVGQQLHEPAVQCAQKGAVLWLGKDAGR